MRKTKLFPVFFAVLMLLIFSAPVSALDLNESTCNGIGGSWDSPGTCTIISSVVFIDTDFNIPADTILNIPAGKMLNISTNAFTNSGTIENYGIINNFFGFTISNSNNINNNVGGTIENSGMIFNYIGTLRNSGNIRNSNSISILDGTFENNAGGNINNSGTISNSGNISNNGTINNNADGTIMNSNIINNYGNISNHNTIRNYGNIINGGTINNNASGYIENWSNITNSCGGYITGRIDGNPVLIVCDPLPESSGILDATTCSIIGGTWSDPGTCTIDARSVVIGTDFTIPAGTILNIPVGKMFDIIANNFNNLGIIDNAGTIRNNDGTINNTGIINNNGRGTINNSGSIINNARGYIYNSGTINNNATGTINNRYYIYNNVGGTINNNGNINNSIISSTISNSGAINNNGIFNNIGSIYNQAGIIINNALGYIENRQSISNIGTISNGGSINNTNTITNSAGGTINNNFGGIINNTDTLTNTGIINNNAGGTINNTDTITNYGDINNRFGGTLTNTGAINNLGGNFTNTGAFINIGIITNYATINNNAGGVLSNNAGGSIENWNTTNNNVGATLINTGTINNSGILSNGAISSAGIINGGGTINNNAGGIINNKAGHTINNNGTINNNAGGTFSNIGNIRNFCGGNITGTIDGNQIIMRCIQSSTGNGGVSFLNNAGTIENLGAVDLSTLPPPPIGANLLYGTFSFNITGIDLRGDVTLILTFPDILPPGTVYWKYQANHDPQWYSITPDEINGTHMTITLTDGGIGDDDGFANRQIHDPGGPGMPQTSGITPHTASSSGGSGGGGVVSSEPYENIAKFETHTNGLSAGLPKNYSLTSPGIVIYQIIVTGKETIDDVMLRVEALKGTSKVISSPPPGIVYKNLNIFAGSKRIEGASIKFKVENKWIEENNIVAGDIKLLKWNGDAWITLNINEIRKDEQFSHFEAYTETFSSFAIVGIPSNGAKSSGSMTTPEVEITSTQTAEKTSSRVQTKKVPGFEVILFMVTFFSIYILGMKR